MTEQQIATEKHLHFSRKGQDVLKAIAGSITNLNDWNAIHEALQPAFASILNEDARASFFGGVGRALVQERRARATR